jgi:hypothetical protein
MANAETPYIMPATGLIGGSNAGGFMDLEYDHQTGWCNAKSLGSSGQGFNVKLGLVINEMRQAEGVEKDICNIDGFTFEMGAYTLADVLDHGKRPANPAAIDARQDLTPACFLETALVNPSADVVDVKNRVDNALVLFTKITDHTGHAIKISFILMMRAGDQPDPNNRGETIFNIVAKSSSAVPDGGFTLQGLNAARDPNYGLCRQDPKAGTDPWLTLNKLTQSIAKVVMDFRSWYAKSAATNQDITCSQEAYGRRTDVPWASRL